MKSILAAVLCAAALAADTHNAQSQGITRVRCDSAGVAVAGHGLPRSGSLDWSNWVALTGCGSRGAAVIAGALHSPAVRTERDISRLDFLTGLLDGWYAPQLVASYEAVAAAGDVTSPLRLRAMWLLAGLFEPSHDVAGPLQAYTASSCMPYGRTTTLRDMPASLPPGAADAARAALAGVAHDKAAPDFVRSTAECWTEMMTGRGAAAEPQLQTPLPQSRDSAPPWQCTWCSNYQPPSAIAGMPEFSVAAPVMAQPVSPYFGYSDMYNPYAAYGYPGLYYYPFGYPALVVNVPLRGGRGAPTPPFVPPARAGGGGHPPTRPPPRPPRP